MDVTFAALEGWCASKGIRLRDVPSDRGLTIVSLGFKPDSGLALRVRTFVRDAEGQVVAVRDGEDLAPSTAYEDYDLGEFLAYCAGRGTARAMAASEPS